MAVAFVAGFAAVVQSAPEAKRFFGDGLGIEFEGDESYPHTGGLPGLKHFGLWSLEEVARSCFGTDEWPADRIVPQGVIEFDVSAAEDVAALCEELTAKGYEFIVPTKTEPWGQTVARLQTPEGLLACVTYTPWMH
jgi:hypothetical protein